MSSLIHIVDFGGDIRSFPATGQTVREILAEFYQVPTAEVESLLETRVFHVVNKFFVQADFLDRPLHAGDTIAVHSKAVAAGGVKGGA